MAGLGRRKGQKAGEAIHYRGPDGDQCTGCKIIKPHSAYTKGNPRTCKACKRRHHFARKYRITLADFEAMLAAQGGLCAICRTRPATYVDHDHRRGGVRGLLCQPCNTALGAFYESSVIMHRAMAYLAAAIAINERA